MRLELITSGKQTQNLTNSTIPLVSNSFNCCGHYMRISTSNIVEKIFFSTTQIYVTGTQIIKRKKPHKKIKKKIGK
jgi:hypothetical protein